MSTKARRGMISSGTGGIRIGHRLGKTIKLKSQNEVKLESIEGMSNLLLNKPHYLMEVLKTAKESKLVPSDKMILKIDEPEVINRRLFRKAEVIIYTTRKNDVNCFEQLVIRLFRYFKDYVITVTSETMINEKWSDELKEVVSNYERIIREVEDYLK